MANRGRPRKDTLSSAAAEAKSQGQSYGHFMEALQKKEVHVEQTDGIKRERAGDRVKIPIPDRAKRAVEESIKQTGEDIQNHKDCIKDIQKEIDQHIGCIRVHEQAIKELEAELKEEKEFLSQFV